MKRLFSLFFLCLAYASSALFGQTSVTPPAGQVGWWPGDDHPLDLVTGIPAALQGDTTYDPGLVDSAFSFDGNGDSVRTSLFASPSELPETTWEAWIYPTTVTGYRPILSTDNGGYDRDMRITSGEFVVFVGSRWNTGLSATADEWQHVAVTYTESDVIFYLNGNRVSRGSPASGGSTSNPLTIGRNPGFNEFFAGQIDEVAIYNRALSDVEITAIFQAGADGMTKPTLPVTDFSVTQEVSTGAVWPGLEYTVSHTVRNEGGAANSPLLQANLPSGLELVSSEGAISCTESGNMIECTLSELDPGAEATVTMRFKVQIGGEKQHLAWVVATGAIDDNPANDNSEITQNVRTLPITAEDGDWAVQEVVLQNTSEAELVVRVGDIDNLGFGWPINFNPFTGASTPSHDYPWTVDPADTEGTDHILVVTSYEGSPPCGRDGYTSRTSRPSNDVRPVTLTFDPSGLAIKEAVVQMFVDDFQAPRSCAEYTATINGRNAPFLANIINALDQTGPVGKLITFQIPPEFLDEVASGEMAFTFDDLITGAGDGYAIDFVKLLINPQEFAETGALSGIIRDTCTNEPVKGVMVSAGGQTTFTDDTGTYIFDNIPAGLLVVTTEIAGYAPINGTIELEAGNTLSLDLSIPPIPQLLIAKGESTFVELYWETCSGNWNLHFSTDLMSWGLVTDPPETASRPGFNSVILDVEATPEAFFQLRQ